MKKILMIALVLLGSVSFAQIPISDYHVNTNLILKGNIKYGKEKVTKLIITSGFDTIINKNVRNNYRVSIGTDKVYEVTFINGDQIKNVLIETAPNLGYKVKLDLDWVLHDKVIAFLLYNEEFENYTFKTVSAGKK